MKPLPAVLLPAFLLLSLAGCASTVTRADGSFVQRYSSFDFSGAGYAAARQRCAQRGERLQHLGTDCGFWTCASRYACAPAGAGAHHNSVGQ